ncbi:ribosomal protein S12 methylthiotransferase [Anaerobranca californiensis DSM 14826]|uniref:Ribosomal protein uS12 methylthiotransferase RimO n=1 Tax=Anaerobranca californiensis DSM 14826 TaxID=1120989 RepID=A0A1M6KC06_9FIRM|nr:30S ribosomal protein S12 methylthiotransferase RimO [Anaerobranca californiensis]SHJ56422.1 ribosomal protein S12 methylthiotransferase [Anaerobranca californiensis DSM 14826]
MVKIATVSLGCPKNTVDSEVMLGILSKEGYVITTEPKQADVIIINTCGFIESAKKESIDTIIEFSRYKAENCQVLIVTGCLVQRYKEELLQEIPEIDGIIGTGEYEKIIHCIQTNLKGDKFVATDNLQFLYDDLTPRMLSTPKYTAYLKIAEGCDNHCTYCIIPALRGKYRSRSIESIVAEGKKLVDNGVKEIILVAQDTTVYGLDLYGKLMLPTLLKKLHDIEGLKWIRILYCYPTYMTDEIIETINKLPKVCNYIDMPIQHGDNEILKKMGRRETKEQLLLLIEKIRKRIPDVVIRTSIIVGFPGETEEHFNNLLRFVEEIKLDRLGVFTYSREEGTAAAKLPNQISERVKKLRQHRLMKVQKRISHTINKEKIGKVFEIIIEGFDNGYIIGRTYGDAPQIDGRVIVPVKDNNKLPGDFIKVLITNCNEYDLIGEIVNESSQ